MIARPANKPFVCSGGFDSWLHYHLGVYDQASEYG